MSLSYRVSPAPRAVPQPAVARPASGPQPDRLFQIPSSVARSPSGGHPFWASSLAGLMVSGLCAVLIVFAIAMVLRRPSQRAVKVRVGSFSPGERIWRARCSAKTKPLAC